MASSTEDVDSKRKILLAHDHLVFCHCLTKVLKEQEDLVIEGPATDTEQAVSLARSLQPEIALVSSQLADAEAMLSLIRDLRSAVQMGILILGASDKEPEHLHLVEAGADGYLPHSTDLDGLKRAIDLTLDGKSVWSPRIARDMFAHLAKLATRDRQSRRLGSLHLTFRELEVLRLVAKGLTNRQIADHLTISPHTVKNHVHNFLRKMEVRSRTAAVAKARELGWL